MQLKLYQIDAFSDRPFGGNPAAVLPLTTWLDDELMQNIAMENNLSETVFFAPEGEDFRIRWFTPETEVDLCGHATLASAYVLYEILGYKKPRLCFHSRSGPLFVERRGHGFAMDFPALPPEPVPTPERLTEALGKQPLEVLASNYHLAVFEKEEDIRAIAPDFSLLAQLPPRGVIITAPGNQVDFVSRFFVPKYGINEDPVTGSAHCHLVPYWARRLGKHELQARQLSKRGGELGCSIEGDRVTLLGRASRFMEGNIEL